MDFFANQDRARKQTTLLVCLFVAAVICIVLSINIVGGVIYLLTDDASRSAHRNLWSGVPTQSYVITTAVVLGVIAFGTLKRMHALSGGGAAVAEMVGARRVQRDTTDQSERRLLNIVEEMAIASGISVPQVYVMDDQKGINAFAAGYSPNEAAVTVTRGTLESLSRDELQGVVAHEFSHILNGDMRLNVRIMGIIAGIVMIGALGRFIMRVGGGVDDTNDSSRYDSRSSSRKSDADLRILLIGIAIWLIGAIGVLFGNLIKAAISRQREFLADASAVQFTRNPEGIGSALFRIGQRGSRVHQRHAEELSHMFFGASVSGFFATHPPIDERIERVMGPGANLLLQDRIRRLDEKAESARPSPVVDESISPLFAPPSAKAATAMAGFAASDGAGTLATTPAVMLASVGAPTTAHVEAARRILRDIPADVRDATRSEAGARAALYALLLGEGEVRAAQMQSIAAADGDSVAVEAVRFADTLKPLGPRLRLPLFELAVSTLATLGQQRRDGLLAMATALINADGKVTLGEFVLLTLCRRHLEKPAKGVPPVKHQTLQDAAKEAAIVLSLLARASAEGEAVYPRIMAALDLKAGTEKPAAFTLSMVETALYELKLLAPLKKPALIKACLEIVMADGQITVTEGELMRAICAALDSPLPPILEDPPANA